ncbi:MAG: FAD-binding domain [Salaquimonas sp.]|nr:FAD-binding domain [Salaquimonas sp.]
MKIAINGAGIAGPTLAYWLHSFGHEPVLYEQAPALRSGGYVIDFWGIGYDIAEKMGLIGQIRELGYQVGEVRFVNSAGRSNGGLSADVFSRMTNDRYTSLKRSDLAAAIYGAIDGKVETVFGDSIAAIEEHRDGVHLSFDHAAPRDFDLVVGADGLHSRVRDRVFGPQEQFETFLGYKVAAFEASGYPVRDERVYVSHTLPGRQTARFTMRDDRTLFLFVYRDENRDLPTSDDERKAVLERIFGKDGWELPQILAAMRDTDGIYFDRVSQIRMDNWTKGRTALIGDAAACASLLAGEGCGLAMTEAYVLAGKLASTGGNHTIAYAAYHDELRDFLQAKQDSARKFASAFAPQTASGIWFRNLVTRLMRFQPIADWFVGRDLRDDIDLPDYEKMVLGKASDVVL